MFLCAVCEAPSEMFLKAVSSLLDGETSTDCKNRITSYNVCYTKLLRFPSHEPDTLKKECLKDIIKAVSENSSDLGLIFDGDGDRLGIIDEKGGILSGDILTAIISNEILKETKGTIVYDLRCSKIVPEIIEKGGGTPVKTRVGHYFIKKLMHEIDAEFAGEFSNHFYFKLVGYFESPLLALYYILKAIENEGKPLSEIAQKYKKYFHSGEINFKVENQKSAG